MSSIYEDWRKNYKFLSPLFFYYAVKNQECVPLINDKMEIAAVKWFPLCALPEEITNKTREQIDEVLGNRKTAKVW